MGYDADAVQAEVNRLITNGERKSITKLASDVLEGAGAGQSPPRMRDPGAFMYARNLCCGRLADPRHLREARL